MKKIIVIAVICFLLGAVAGTVIAAIGASDRPAEYVINRVWDTTTNTLKIKGQ